MPECWECAAPASHHHHVVPKCRGGTRTIPLCEQCHGKVHGKKNMSISSLTKQGLKNRKEAGLWIGPRPYGFNVQGGKLTPNPEEQAIMRVMEKKRAANLSLREIADFLTAQGLKTQRGRVWRPMTVKNALRFSVI